MDGWPCKFPLEVGALSTPVYQSITMCGRWMSRLYSRCAAGHWLDRTTCAPRWRSHHTTANSKIVVLFTNAAKRVNSRRIVAPLLLPKGSSFNRRFNSRMFFVQWKVQFQKVLRPIRSTWRRTNQSHEYILSSAKSGPGSAYYFHANVRATSQHIFERSCGHWEVCCVVVQTFAWK